MFVLFMRDGSRLEVPAADRLEALREAVRHGAAALQLDDDPAARLDAAGVLQALGLGRPGLFDGYGPHWSPPTDAEVRELLKVARLTSSTAGRLVGVSGGKVRKWAGKEPGLVMPYAVWRLLSTYAGAAPFSHVLDNEIKD